MKSVKELTTTCHVEDDKSSHANPKVNDEFHTWCDQKYGSEETRHR